jgi:hypothetical protein
VTQHPVHGLSPHEADVQQRADRKGGAEIGGRMVVVMAAAMAVAVMVMAVIVVMTMVIVAVAMTVVMRMSAMVVIVSRSGEAVVAMVVRMVWHGDIKRYGLAACLTSYARPRPPLRRRVVRRDGGGDSAGAATLEDLRARA